MVRKMAKRTMAGDTPSVRAAEKADDSTHTGSVYEPSRKAAPQGLFGADMYETDVGKKKVAHSKIDVIGTVLVSMVAGIAIVCIVWGIISLL